MTESAAIHTDPVIGKVLSPRPFSVDDRMLDNYLSGLALKDKNQTVIARSRHHQ